MKNRYGFEVRRGAVVRAHLPRGGSVHGVVTALRRMPGYGWRATVDNAHTVSVDDCAAPPVGTQVEIETMARHYLIAAAWADAPEGTSPRITHQATLAAIEQCAAFLRHIGADKFQQIKAAHSDGYGTHPDCGNVAPYCAALGHDFYLTRAGHGVGFLDRDSLPEELREYLDSLCGWSKLFGEPEVEFYRGWIHVIR